MPSKIIVTVETNGQRRDLHTMELPPVPLEVAVDPDSQLLAERAASSAIAAASIVVSGGRIMRA